LLEIIFPKGDASMKTAVELAFYRSQIYSRMFNLHEQAHEEMHYVIENRELLGKKINKS
jgi:hypothetical protein